MERKFGDKLGLLDLTESEIKRLGECMKDDKFMELLRDYAMAISNPENKKKYEEEIAALELERGVDVRFINPCPGHVLKTSKDGEEKCFVNICSSPQVGKPVNKPTVQGSTRGMQWSIPHSLSQPRDDTDKAGGKCVVYDVVFHPDTYHMAQKNERFKRMIHDMALDAVERLFKVTLDKVNVKKPKMKFKGVPTASMIRTPREDTRELDSKDENDPDDPLKFPYPPINDLQNHKEPEVKEVPKKVEKPQPAAAQKPEPANHQKTQEATKIRPTNDVRADLLTMMECIDGKREEFVEPKYTLTHRGYFDMKDYYNINDHSVLSTRPRELLLNIELPLLKAASAIHLEIFEDRVQLECAKPVKYKLFVKLPYHVDDSKGHARFDKSKRRLTITLEVLPPVGKHPYSALMVLQDEKQDACGSCVREQMTRQSGKKGVKKEEPVEDPSENELQPSDHPSGLVHGLSTCRHTKHGEMWGKSYDENWQQDKDLKFLYNTSPQLVERLASAMSKKPRFIPFVKERPNIHYHQDEAFVSIIVNVKFIDPNKLWYIVCPDNLQFSAMAEKMDRKMPKVLQLYIKFAAGDLVDPRRSRVDVSDDNAVFLLRKHIASWHEWQKFELGYDQENMKELSFTTEDNVNHLLSTIASESRTSKPREFTSEVVSDEKETELLALKLTPTEIVDEERLSTDDEGEEFQDMGELPALIPTRDEVLKIREKKGPSAKIDHDKLLLKTLSKSQDEENSAATAETDEDDDSDDYETAESSDDKIEAATKPGPKRAKKSDREKTKNSEPEAQSGAQKQEGGDPEEDTQPSGSEDGAGMEEPSPELKEFFAKINANAMKNIQRMQDEAARNNERIVFREWKAGGGEKKKETVSDHRTKSVIMLDNNMLFEIDYD